MGIHFPSSKGMGSFCRNDIIRFMNEFYVDSIITLGCNASFFTLISILWLFLIFDPLAWLQFVTRSLPRFWKLDWIWWLIVWSVMNILLLLKVDRLWMTPYGEWVSRMGSENEEKYLIMKINFEKMYGSLSWDYLV